MSEIVLTAARTIMSDYHGKMVFGFASSASKNSIPEPLFQWLFFPKGKTIRGVPEQAHIGLRRVEAKLLENGFDVKVVDPDHLSNELSDAKVLGVHAHDPLGLGPNSITWRSILGGDESYSAKYFRELMLKPEVRKAKKNGCKFIGGGTGVWQLVNHPKYSKGYGFDCLLEGEAEKLISQICWKAMNDEELPFHIQCTSRTLPDIFEIPNIRYPTTCGLVEVGRGCPRGCHFCSVTRKKLRWFPYDYIEKDLSLNRKYGFSEGILMAEDLLLYGSSGIIPNKEKVLKLFKLTKRYYRILGWSHISLAAVKAAPDLIEESTELILQDQNYIGVEIGIETGSPRLVENSMPAKAKPFEAKDWPKIVVDAMTILADNGVVPYTSIILGLPKETEDDVIKTIDLIENLKQFRCLILPLFFIPLGGLKKERVFDITELTERHQELLLKCFNHDCYHIKRFLREFLGDRWYGPLAYPLYSSIVKFIERKAKKTNMLVPDYIEQQSPSILIK